jgi:DNA invertase Pin-like site-specific DNA recombinase
MTGVIYARYSSDNQREESIEGQLRECKEFAVKNDITILGTYIDRALSAKTDNRPEFQHMIKDSEKNMFDVILVWKLDRFARNRYDSAHYKAILKKNGVKVVSATETISQGAEGILLESLLEGYAEYYSAELSEKVIRGMKENALKCKYNGGTLPIGYVVDEEKNFQIDPLVAPIILDAFKRYADGATMKDIVDELKLKGVRTKKNGEVSINSVTRMLHNRKYIGEYSYRDVVVPDGIPAIVPKNLFDKVQEKLTKNKKAPARHKADDDYLLTTKLYCGYCKSFMVGESGTSHTQNKHRYYKCVGVKKHTGCKKKTVKKEWIEDLVINAIQSIILDDATLIRIADMLYDYSKQESTTLPYLKKQFADVEKGIDNILNAIQMGIFTSSTKTRLEELEQQKEDLKIKIMQEETVKQPITQRQILFWLTKLRDYDINIKENKQRLIDIFVNAIYLYDDRIVFVFNHQNDTETIKFEDIESSQISSDFSSLGAPIRNRTYIE